MDQAEVVAPDREGVNNFHGLVGASRVMRQLYRRIEAAAATRSTVLIIGATGTGKELVARAVHECSPGPAGPFVALNCAALPVDLIESELFGYRRGAFSGAAAEYLGLFRSAEGGTLFLDEITEMGAATQSKLLRAIQERAVRPVGSTREAAVDVRLIASSNRDPQAAIATGQLREDLYYRLQVNVVAVPLLRERREDIPLLIDHFMALFNDRFAPRQPIGEIQEAARRMLEQYPWPGNVRELANTLESAFTFGRPPTITVEDLPPAIGRQTENNAHPSAQQVRSFEEVESDLIRRALASTAGNKAQAARLLGISRKKLYAKIEKYRLLACLAMTPGFFGSHGFLSEPTRPY